MISRTTPSRVRSIRSPCSTWPRGVVSQGFHRRGDRATRFTPADGRSLLLGWLEAVGIDSGAELLELMQSDGFSHAELHRRARNAHDLRLGSAAERASELFASGDDAAGGAAALASIFAAALPAVPYVPATSFLSGEQRRLSYRDESVPRIALVVDAIGSMHGVSHTIERLRETGVPGFEVEVIGTDPGVDRRLPTVTELEVPYYEGLRVGGTEPAAALGDDRRRSVRPDPRRFPRPGGNRRSPRRAGVGHPPDRQPPHRAGQLRGTPLRSTRDRLRRRNRARDPLRTVRAGPLSELRSGPIAARSRPLPRTDRALGSRGSTFAGSILPVGTRSASRARSRSSTAGDSRTRRGSSFSPRASRGRGERDPRLHLLLAGDGPERGALQDRLGDSATFPRLARRGGSCPGSTRARTSSCSPSQTDTYGQVVVEAQASGLAVVAAAGGGPLDLITDGGRRHVARADHSGACRRRARARGLRGVAAAPRPRRPSFRRLTELAGRDGGAR